MNVAHCDDGVVLGLRRWNRYGVSRHSCGSTETSCSVAWEVLALKLGRIARSCAFALSDALGLPVYGMSLEAGSAGLQLADRDASLIPSSSEILFDGVFCEAITDYLSCVLWIENIENVLHSMEECFGSFTRTSDVGASIRACDGTEVILVASEGSGLLRIAHATVLSNTIGAIFLLATLLPILGLSGRLN